MRIIGALLLSLSLFLLSWKHEYHVSISQIDYNTASSTLQVSMKLHDEDVELLLDKNLETVSTLEKDLERREVEEFLVKYIHTSFQLLDNGSEIELKFIGKEMEEGDLWMYFESTEFTEMKELEVKNTLFLELFHDQSNLVHYSKDNQIVLSAVLNKQKRSHQFILE